ncbi:uncharacterized protein PAC_01823 [Phialocephala subalpina]|uniref:Uncharacterized protein n=1 Tax=Phialocephala subalpina TaxID=576137 RepID=A0A1L7WGN5_9HELO|nr:uncharacterized protein PAC_01823 [Phialocephala subalpina]
MEEPALSVIWATGLAMLFGQGIYFWWYLMHPNHKLAIEWRIILYCATASVYLQLLEHALGMPIIPNKVREARTDNEGILNLHQRLDILFSCYYYGFLVPFSLLWVRHWAVTLVWCYDNFGEDAQYSRHFNDRHVKVTHDDKWVPETPSFMTREDAEGDWICKQLDNGTLILRSTMWKPQKYKYVFVDMTGFVEWNNDGYAEYAEIERAYKRLVRDIREQARRRREEEAAHNEWHSFFHIIEQHNQSTTFIMELLCIDCRIPGNCLTPLEVLGIKIERINNEIYLIYLIYMWFTLKALDNIECIDKYCPFFIKFLIGAARFTQWYWDISSVEPSIINDPTHPNRMTGQAIYKVFIWHPKTTFLVWLYLKVVEEVIFKYILLPIWAAYARSVDRKIEELEELEKAGPNKKWNDTWGRKL